MSALPAAPRAARRRALIAVASGVLIFGLGAGTGAAVAEAASTSAATSTGPGGGNGAPGSSS